MLATHCETWWCVNKTHKWEDVELIVNGERWDGIVVVEYTEADAAKIRQHATPITVTTGTYEIDMCVNFDELCCLVNWNANVGQATAPPLAGFAAAGLAVLG